MAFMGRALERVKSKKNKISIEDYLSKSTELYELKRDFIKKYEQMQDLKQAEQFKKKGIKAITKKENELAEIKQKIDEFNEALNVEMERYGNDSLWSAGLLGQNRKSHNASSQRTAVAQPDNKTTMIEECYRLLKTCATKDEYQKQANEVVTRHRNELLERLNNKQDEKANLELE